MFKKIKTNTSDVIVYLTGRPGVGKYTIAQELAAIHGFIICDNHLINNPIFKLLQSDGLTKIPEFAWDAIDQIRTVVFEFLTQLSGKSFVLTNNLYANDGDKNLYACVKNMADLKKSLFVPVKLFINQDAHLKRVTDRKRLERFKSIDPQDVYDTTPLLDYIHPNLLELDISNLNPTDSANAIFAHIDKLKMLRLNYH